MIDDPTETDGRPPLEPTTLRSAVAAAALPIPELVVVDDVADVTSAFAGGGRLGPPVAPADRDPDAPGQQVKTGPTEVVGDDERTRYGLLLDRAAERGLLTPAEYEIRLRELASATTVERMREVVTELPILDGPVTDSSKRARFTTRPVSSDGALVATGTVRRRSSPWFVLVVVVLALVVALVFFSFYAEHLAHTRNSGLAREVAARGLSALRS